jgi:hypothetical protein
MIALVILSIVPVIWRFLRCSTYGHARKPLIHLRIPYGGRK